MQLERGGERQDSRTANAVERRDALDPKLPLGERAGLVERDAPDRGQPLEPRAALDQHALARRRRQRGHDRDRRRDHERARAGDDEQHERAIDPVGPRSRP